MPADKHLENGDWDSCKMHVLLELKRMNVLIEKSNEKLDVLRESQIILKAKVMMYGIAAGFVVTVITNMFVQGWFKR